MKLTNKQLLGVGVAGVVALWYLKKKAGETAAAVGNAINPVNPENVFYAGVNNVGEALTGDEAFSLGSWLYGVTHDE